MLLINADDWGWEEEVTDRILRCHRQGGIQAASGMTFMEDSERAAGLAQENNLPVGLHLNLTLDFTWRAVPSNLKKRHRAIAGYLNGRKWNQLLYNPFLQKDFDYVFQSQWEEFIRLYGKSPARLDGHHHMHLCMNMLLLNKYPKGIRVRRNFTFDQGEKSWMNRLYRYLIDRWLTPRFHCTDHFFSLKPIDRERIRKILLLSKSKEVELMVHPSADEECSYLLSEDWLDVIHGASDKEC